MKSLSVPASIVTVLKERAAEDMPNEACGMLAGSDGVVEHFYPMTNADASPEHYTLVPREQFDVMKNARGRGLQLLAVWHSHPETPARMSDEDIRLAYATDVYYVILSLAVPESEALRGFEMIDGAPVEISVTITED